LDRLGRRNREKRQKTQESQKKKKMKTWGEGSKGGMAGDFLGDEWFQTDKEEGETNSREKGRWVVGMRSENKLKN